MAKKKTTTKIEVEEKAIPEIKTKAIDKVEEDTVGKQTVQSKSQPAQSKNQANQSGA